VRDALKPFQAAFSNLDVSILLFSSDFDGMMRSP